MKATIITFVIIGFLAIFAGFKINREEHPYDDGASLFVVLLMAVGSILEILAGVLFVTYVFMSMS